MLDQTEVPSQTWDVRLLVVSPVFNEARHLPTVAAAVAAQTRLPDRWVIVDDGSTDGTRAVLTRLEAQLPFVQVITLPHDAARGADGLACAREIRAFNAGLDRQRGERWDYVAKLDGDMELPPHYFERLLRRFGASPGLGLAGGRFAEPRADGSWRVIGIPPQFVPGALKTYRVECLERIGGVQECLGWDTIDETYARLHGYETRSFGDLDARHHRPTGTASGLLRGRARHGACAWITHYPAYFVLLRSVKQATFPPFGLSGLAFLWGYFAAAVRATPQVPDPAFRRHIRSELHGRFPSARPRGGSLAVLSDP
jgi:biofilm PGA synthesis N-glycosyltransferase PgaC